MIESKTMRVRADFNGLFGELLCLSHKDTCEDADGNLVTLHAGMVLTAFDEDVDDHGNRDDLIASGTVEPSPNMAVVEKVSFYHGGDVLYNLKDIPGTWHEQCLLAA